MTREGKQRVFRALAAIGGVLLFQRSALALAQLPTAVELDAFIASALVHTAGVAAGIAVLALSLAVGVTARSPLPRRSAVEALAATAIQR